MKNKLEPWRLIVGIISILFIIVMWVAKDVGKVYATLPKEDLLPVIVTSLTVTLVKVAFISIGIIIIKKITKK